MPYEPCGRPFISLALTLGDENPQPLCILDLIIDLMSTKVNKIAVMATMMSATIMMMVMTVTMMMFCLCR